MSSASKPVLVVTRLLPSQAQARLDSLGDRLTITQHKSTEAMSRQELLTAVRGADGLVCLLSDRIDHELLSAAGERLKVVSTVSVGYDHVDLKALQTHGALLGHTPDVLTDATADTTALLALMAARQAKRALQLAMRGTAAFSLSTGLGCQFTGKTLGIVGLGRIGAATAQRLKPFGFAHVLYSAPRPQPERECLLDARHVDFDELLRRSDLVCICCPLNSHTWGMFDAAAFASMKPSAILVNTARGAIVDQNALLSALDQGLLAHAALDVTVPEPLPADHPLVVHPRCTVLPHIGSATEEARNAMGNLAIDNALAGIYGEPLPAQVHL
ncbi:hypothetical protein LPJ73_001853 [Coemansia sp. RSA 2703]|nr:hypothetical protein LPJ73_001853 [Coemansia sp. RSA 2703]KAJ2363314.1 hypothetical protein IW150_006767 [Coemansia sp. RSA 2607]KAJ2383157.1 hypothetical protein GGI05_005406 [Coemansia sp. RSA 2603]